MTYAVYGRRSHKMKQSQNTRVVSCGRRAGGVVAGERKGSGSHSGEWRGSGVLACAREKATALALGPRRTERNTETVEQKQPPSLDIDSMRGPGRAPIRSREY